VPRLHPGPLVVATHNPGKLEEIADLLGPYGVKPVAAAALGLPVPAETEATFAGNALIKARAAGRAAMVALADDSGLCVDALGGAPGVLTADWAEGPGGRDFDRAMRRLWQALEAAGAEEPRRAQFRCALALVWPDGREAVFDGAMPGRIVWPRRGAQGHGFDPVFQPDGFSETFGEMDRWQKNRISHRGRAFARLVAECFT
jgi:XTP/dITP diphosphohydrolase